MSATIPRLFREPPGETGKNEARARAERREQETADNKRGSLIPAGQRGTAVEHGMLKKQAVTLVKKIAMVVQSR